MIQAAKGAFPFPILCTDERIMSRNLCQDASKSPSDTPEPSEGGNGKASETSAYTGLYPSALSDISVSWRTFLPDSHEPGKLLPLFQADDRMYDFQYLNDYRIFRSIHLMKTTAYSLSSIASLTGFSNASRFAAAFRKKTGCSPSEYRRNHFTVS